ncbi:MAG: neutral zinc metallopeptidase, partial [Propionibacteriaceae bacterium]
MTQSPWGNQPHQFGVQQQPAQPPAWQQPRTPWNGYGAQAPVHMPMPVQQQPYYGQHVYGQQVYGQQVYGQQPPYSGVPAARPGIPQNYPGYGSSPYGQPYPGPYGYPQAYPAPKPKKSPFVIVLIGVLATILILLTMIMVLGSLASSSDTKHTTSTRGNNSSTSNSSGYQNDDYVAPDIDADPPYPPIPTTAQIESWLTDNALYAQPPLTNVRCELQPIDPHANVTSQEEAMNEFIACLMKVWTVPVTDAGYVLPRPGVTIYDQPVQTPCGKQETHNAFYCMSNQQFYYATDLIEALPDSISSKAWIVEVILAHEFGHAVQGRSGIL